MSSEIRPEELAILHGLNEDALPHVNSLSAAELAHLAGRAAYLRVAHSEGDIAAFLIGFDAHADYASLNLRWFKARYSDFLYIDRIVVGEAWRRRGLASRLYLEAEDYCRAHGLNSLVCEVNSEPPNPESSRFHATLGFVEVGIQTTGGKTVSLLRKLLH